MNCDSRICHRNKETAYLSILSVLSAVAVVFLHVNSCFWTYSREIYWKQANVIESVCYFAVPVFFMISGVKLIDYRKRYSTAQYLKKRLIKTFLPFLIWSIAGLVFKIIMGRTMLSELSVGFVLQSIFRASIIEIYWFFPALFFVYLSIVFVSCVKEDKRKIVYGAVCAAYFSLCSILPFAADQGGGILPESVRRFLLLFRNWPLHDWVGYVCYAMAGYWLSKYCLSKTAARCIYICSIIGLLAHLCGTQVLSDQAGEIIQSFKGYLNVPCICYVLGLFLFFRNYGNRFMQNRIVGCAAEWLERYTFGIYLVHFYVIQVMRNYVFEAVLGIPYTSLVYRLLVPVLTIGISVIVIRVIRAMPGGKWIVP